jgi:iron complex outermembrane recepter protein
MRCSFYLVQFSLFTILLPINPATAEEISDRSNVSSSAKDLLTQPEGRSKKVRAFGRTPLQKLAQNSQQTITRVTGVEVKQTDSGLELILKTAAGSKRLVPLILPEGNDLVIEITDATLAFGIRNGVEQLNPANGINKITVNKIDESSIRVRIAGETQTPSAEVVPGSNLVLSVNPQGSTARQAPDEEIEIIATGEQEEEGYRVTDTNTATKTDTPIRDVPGNIQVIPQEIIKDQGAIRIDEAVRNVSGVNFSQNSGGRDSLFNVRGFEANQYKNGFLEDFFSTRTETEIANIERIEILKGPASVLFGQSQPSGTINIVTKKPLKQPYLVSSFTAGSYELIRPSFDISWPLNKDGSLAYRLNFAFESADSFRDTVQTERVFVAPVLQWEISDRTTLTLEGEYLADERPIDRGIVAIGNSPADLPVSRFLGDATRQGEFDEYRGYLSLKHQFSDRFTFNSSFRVTSSREEGSSLEASELLEDNRTLLLGGFAGGQYYETYTWQNDLISKFNTGAIDHTLLFGFELNRKTAFLYDNFFDTAENSIDIFNPVYEFTSNLEPDTAFNNSTTKANGFGIYLQDQIAFTDNLKMVLGGRFDTYESKDRNPNAPEFDADLETEAFSPRIGIVYQPIKPISLYANYSESFFPQTGLLTGGGAVQPEIGEQYEIGVKADVLDNRISTTLAFYDITKSNVLTDDPNNPDPDFSIQVGEQKSQGVELDVKGEILPGWDVIASYAYTDAKISEDNSFPVDNRLNNVPFNTVSLWTNYEFQNNALKGFALGAGLFFVDERSGDLDNSFTVDGYTRVDAAISYTTDNLRLAVNFKNLFDTKYFDGSQSSDSITPGEPFTVQGTLSVNW